MSRTFSIRTLLLLTAIAAVCALMMRTSDWIAAVGFGISAGMMMGGIRGFATPRSATKLIRATLILVGIVIGWFSVVDLSFWCEWCHHCTEHRYVHEVRVCGLPVWNTRGQNHIDNMAQLRADLNFSCNHEYGRLHLVRVWGFVYRARPARMTAAMTRDSEFYDNHVSKRAREFARDNPIAARRLCEHIINNEDYDEMHAFIATMKQPDAEWNVSKRFNAAEQTKR